MNTFPKQTMVINQAGVVPAAGGVNTDWDKAQLPLGTYSDAKNVRLHGTGFRIRPGLERHHTTDLGKVMSLFSYKRGEKFFAQLSDGDVYEATDNPPATTAGAFGSLVVDESALDGDTDGQALPGSWSTLREHVLLSQGATQHLAYPGTVAKPVKIMFKGSTTDPGRMPYTGQDITNILIDPDSTKVTPTLTWTVADYDALYICTEFPATDFIIDLGTAAVGATKDLDFFFFDGDDWVEQTTGLTDGTTGFASDGTIVATMAGRVADGDELPTVMFGRAGYWYKIELNSTTAVESITFKSIQYEGDFRPIENVMDDIPAYAVECQVEQASGTEWTTYAASYVVIDALAIGDYVYIATTSKPFALYLDPGSTPNANASTITAVEVLSVDGAWDAAANVEDGTTGLKNPGFITWDRSSVDQHQGAFNGSLNHMYWTRFKVASAAVSATVALSVTALFHYDISDLGESGRVSTTWKDRGLFTFSKFGRDIYVSKKYRPNTLNGSDYAVLTPGDGRDHDVTAMIPFYNELMVFQKEEGTPGGCITLFEGYTPDTFGRLVLSTKLGTFSAQSVCIVDASVNTTRTTDVTQTQVAFISKYGIFMTDGRTIQNISGPISNYFDPEKAQYIDTDFAAGDLPHWISYDRQGNCLRVGLRTKASSTNSPDAYPVFHLDTGDWTFDEYENQSVTAFSEVTAETGTIDSLQYCAGIDLNDSTQLVYRCIATNDYDEHADGTKDAIVAALQIEFSNGANLLQINELSIRSSSSEDYTLTKTVYENGVVDTSETETFNMLTEDLNGLTFRERILEALQLNHHFSVRLSWTNTAAPASWGTGPVIYDLIHDIATSPNIN